MVLSLLWAPDAALGWQELKLWLSAGAVFLVVATVAQTAIAVRAVLAAFVVGGLLSVLVGVLHGTGGRFVGAENDPNGLALVLLPAMVFAAVLAAERRNLLLRAGLVAAAVVLTVAFAATESRGGLVGLGVAVLAAPLVLVQQRRVALAATGVLVVVTVAALAVAPGGLHRVTSFSDQGQGRLTLWTVAWRATEHSAPVGVGLNGFRAVEGRYVRQPGALTFIGQVDNRTLVHDAYLQLLTDLGIPGLALFAAVVVACLAAARRAARAFDALGDPWLARIAGAVLLVDLGMLATLVFLSEAVDPRIWAVLALGPALLALAYRRSRLAAA
jgi:O-antigen ligase